MWQFDPLWPGGSTFPPVTGDPLQIPDPLQAPAEASTSQQNDREQQQEDTLPPRPGSQFTRDTWWDALLTYYATEQEPGPDSMQVVTLSTAQRTDAMKSIMADIKALLQSSPSWVSIINLPRFFDTLLNPVRRHSLQPSLLLSVLALGTLAQSSEAEKGARGRQRAFRLLEMAHGALEGALATGWVDIGLAQAAYVSHSHSRSYSMSGCMTLCSTVHRVFRDAAASETDPPPGPIRVPSPRLPRQA